MSFSKFATFFDPSDPWNSKNFSLHDVPENQLLRNVRWHDILCSGDIIMLRWQLLRKMRQIFLLRDKMLRDICSADICSADNCSADNSSGDICSADNCSADNSSENTTFAPPTLAPATDALKIRHLLRRYLLQRCASFALNTSVVPLAW